MTARTTSGVQEQIMLRKRPFFGALVVFLAQILGGLPGVARASTVAQLNFTFNADYQCVGPCASATSFSGDGTAQSGSKVFGALKYSLGATELSFDPVTGCIVSAENTAFTTQKGKNTVFLSSTSDIFCPTANPNISLESGTLTVTGGTGIFSAATGTGTFSFIVYTHPQNATDTFNLTITY